MTAVYNLMAYTHHDNHPYRKEPHIPAPFASLFSLACKPLRITLFSEQAKNMKLKAFNRDCILDKYIIHFNSLKLILFRDPEF
jgi:hypothetical protein